MIIVRDLHFFFRGNCFPIILLNRRDFDIISITVVVDIIIIVVRDTLYYYNYYLLLFSTIHKAVWIPARDDLNIYLIY